MKLIKALLLSLMLCSINGTLSYAQSPKQASQPMSIVVSGKCGMCKARIEKAALAQGATTATWDAATQRLLLTSADGSLAIPELQRTLASLGHDTELISAADNIYAQLPACCHYPRTVQPSAAATPTPTIETPIANATAQRPDGDFIFSVAGNCGMCKSRIEKAALGAGATQATWDVATQQITVLLNKPTLSLTTIKQAIANAGHDTDDIKADDATYAKLHECCLYRKSSVSTQHDDHDHEHDHEHIVRGVVVEENAKGDLLPIVGVNIGWLDNAKASVHSNENGVFTIPHRKGMNQLVVSYVGMQADTITVKDLHEILVIHARGNVLSEVVVTGRQRSSFIQNLSAHRVETITAKELFKAACCDLSESFETNASVDVVSNDALTGSKQIQLLGLSGIYTMLTVENMPGPRGFAQNLGLNSIAGPWIESIQISKGMGSVANGFESMAGQINIELKKPQQMDRLYFNAYVNNMGRTDFNLNLGHKINEKWSVGLLLHDNFMYNKNMNFSHNGFRDMPVGNVFSGINRWHYENGQGFFAQFGIKFQHDDRIGGAIDFNEDTDKLSTNSYGIGFDVERLEGFAKLGYVFPSHKLRSIGLQLSATHYQQDAYFGLTSYNNKQNSGYANLLYQDVLGSVKHKYRLGASVQHDAYREQLWQTAFVRDETVSGAFAEYTFAPHDAFDVVAGIRQDYNSIYGWFTTPRLSLRYAPWMHTTIRLNTGKGQRTANVFAENLSLFASSRTLQLAPLAHQTHAAYGLQQEVSWNSSFTIDQSMHLWNREAGLSLELFHNNFKNQLIVDLEDPRSIRFYNLNGKSFSNSLQASFFMSPIKNLETKIAYRLLDVQTDYQQGRLAKPMIAKHRGFVNLAYTMEQGWNFDYTLNLVGKKRIPNTDSNPTEFQLAEYSKAYTTMNAQVSKTLGKDKNMDIYLGVENITNFFQKNPILGFEDPFGPHFDTNMLWGPLSGRLIYSGIRYTLK